MKVLKKSGIKALSLLLAAGMTFAFTACQHEHSYSNEWSADETYHWRNPTCDDTDEPADKNIHNFVNDVCTRCGYEKTHTHTFSNKWTYDETNHWHKATCGHDNEISDKAEHDLKNGLCTVCDYDASHMHTFSDKWSHDEDYHWHEATCGDTDEVRNKESHSFSTDGVCKCGYKKEVGGDSEDSKYGQSYVDGLVYKEILGEASEVIGFSVSVGNLNKNKEIEIPATYRDLPVTEISDSGFLNCAAESITIPNSVVLIGQSAFSSCDSLKSVVIPNSVTKIGDWSFSGCSALKQVTFSNSMTEIPFRAFANCNALESVEIPNNITVIGQDAFRYCNDLKRITIGTGLKSSGKDAFLYCSALEGVYIQDLAAWCAIEFSTEYTFINTTGDEKDDFYTLGSSNPLYYAQKLYLNNTLLENLVLNDAAGVENVSKLAFVHLSVKKITITNKVKMIRYSAFHECRAESLELAAQAIEFSSNNYDGIFKGSTKLKTVEIDMPIIGNAMFSGCTALETVTLSTNVKTISFAAFANCSSLKDIHYKGTDAGWNGIQKSGQSYSDDGWNYNTGNYTIHFSDGTTKRK